MIATVIRAAFLLSGYGRYVITTDKSAHTHFPFSRSYFKTYCKVSTHAHAHVHALPIDRC